MRSLFTLICLMICLLNSTNGYTGVEDSESKLPDAQSDEEEIETLSKETGLEEKQSVSQKRGEKRKKPADAKGISQKLENQENPRKRESTHIPKVLSH
jgi:hypothetical protein